MECFEGKKKEGEKRVQDGSVCLVLVFGVERGEGKRKWERLQHAEG